MSLSSCPWVDWKTIWSCVSNLILLYILSLKASFTSNTRWESQTLHDKNSSVIYSGGFSKSFGLELTTFPRFFKWNCSTLNYTLHYITQHYVHIWHHAKEGKMSFKMRPCLKVFEGGIVGVSSNNLIMLNILCKKETQTIMLVQLRYCIEFFNSRSFLWYYHSKKIQLAKWLITFDIPQIYLFLTYTVWKIQTL